MRTLAVFGVLCSAIGCGPAMDGTVPPFHASSPKADDPVVQPDLLAPPTEPSPPVATVDAGTDDAATCGGQEFKLERVPPNVMLVLDRSGSMNGTISASSTTPKWTDLKVALQSLVTTYDAQMRLGVSIYSSDGDCGPGDITPLAAANGATVISELNAKGPSGNTPTAATLDKVRTQGQLNDPSRDNVVVLATDGIPNCPDVDVAGKITALYNSTPSVRTYVIGVGDGTATDPTLLSAWADAGHTALPGATKYYQTNSPAELKAAFDGIAVGIVSCSFKLGSAAPDPSQLYVFSNSQPVPADAVNGYSYDPGIPSVVLHGAACDALKNTPSTKIQVVYGCPTPPPIN